MGRLAPNAGRRLAGAAARALLRLTAAVLAVGCVACGGGDGGPVPDRLEDGTRPAPVPQQLDIDDAVMTSVRVLAARQATGLDACLARFDLAARPERVVERVGVLARSLTFRHPEAPQLLGCQESSGAREQQGRWCEGAAGLLRGGALTDARLSLVNCVDREGATVASAWLEPLPESRWLAVEQDGYTEIYAAAGGLPIRIGSNRGIGEDGSSLEVQVAQYAADGTKLDERELELRVAG